jgi:hypothetical protein
MSHNLTYVMVSHKLNLCRWDMFLIFRQVQNKQWFDWRATHRFGLRSQRLELCNLSTTSPLAINRITIQLTSPRRLILVANRRTQARTRLMQLNWSDNCRYMIKHSKFGFRKQKMVTVRWQIDLKQNSNPNVDDGYWLYSLREVQGPHFTSIRCPNTLKGPTVQKTPTRSAMAYSGRQLDLIIPVDSKGICGPQTKAIG